MRHFLPLFILLFTLSNPLSAQNKFFSPEEAFAVDAHVADDKLLVTFTLAEDIYLYKDKIFLTITPNDHVSAGDLTLPLAQKHEGESVYADAVQVTIPLLGHSQAAGTRAFELNVAYQGCSEQGLCYEPRTQKFDVEVETARLSKADMPNTEHSKPAQSEKMQESETGDPITALLSGGNIFYILGGFFIFGLLLSLTPCVFPMVPILSSVIISHGSQMSTKKAFMLSMVYVQAMALTYTIAGIVAGLSGAGVQAAFQTPWVIGAFAGVFVLLALSMFGLFEIQMPQAVQSYLNKKTKGNSKGYASIAVMGLFSALIVGPCVAAPLAAALGFISQTGDAVLGGMALYALSMGMGVPLLIVGTGAGKFMPRPGAWMDAVKSIFGVLMLAVAIWMLSRILDNALVMFLWAALAMFVAVTIGAFDLNTHAGCRPCYGAKKSIGMIMFLYATVLFLGALTHAPSILNPLEKLMPKQPQAQTALAQAVNENSFQKIHSIAELDAILSQSKGKKIMLDFYADWCTSCKELEHLTFSDTRVKKALAGYVLIQADITANSDEEKALSQKFGLFGPPALIFYDTQGKELRSKRSIGFLPPAELLEKL